MVNFWDWTQMKSKARSDAVIEETSLHCGC